ncbi:MAG: hypothetical protein MRY64_02660 [Hyphomonadaceae bacterium]|nr:hypothetical protein [Hyphomonadaceae bacterium]
MILKTLKIIGALAVLALIFLIASSCTMLGLNYASLETANKVAPRPQISAETLMDWEAGRAALMSEFEEVLYGPWPAGLPVTLLSRRVADPEFAGGRAILEELRVQIGEGPGASDVYLGLAVPKQAGAGSLGLVIGQTFSDNCSVFSSLALTQPSGELCDSTEIPWLIEYIFGEYIAEVPFEAYFDAGYAYASFYASDLVPDRAAQASAVMAGLEMPDGRAPTSTLMAWAYGYSAAIDLLAGEAWLDGSRIAVFGHSRHGKSALLAGIWDRRIDRVIAHQSGFGGAALSRSQAGERLDRVQKSYPHWFDPGLAAYSERLEDLPVDQHQLLALLAPTPVFLGNGRRDVWSDPNSTFRAAEAASRVYALYSEAGLGAETMLDYRPGDGLAYFLRPGGHGTDKRDVAAIIAFLQAQDVPGGTRAVLLGTD